jgi:hypothetical protein
MPLRGHRGRGLKRPPLSCRLIRTPIAENPRGIRHFVFFSLSSKNYELSLRFANAIYKNRAA